MQLKNSNDLIPHIILGRGNDKTRNEKWQFYIESIEADAEYTDTTKPNAAKEYKRSILHISASNLLTEGGKIKILRDCGIN